MVCLLENKQLQECPKFPSRCDGGLVINKQSDNIIYTLSTTPDFQNLGHP